MARRAWTASSFKTSAISVRERRRPDQAGCLHWPKRVLRGCVGGASLLGCLLSPNRIHASDPLNSNNRPRSAIEATGVSAHDSQESRKAHNDVNVVPIVGGSTDLGVGGGYFAGFARMKPGHAPYVWNLDSSGLITFKYRSREGITAPMQDLYARLTIPRLLGSPLRLQLRPSYTYELIDYFGMGNASATNAPPGASGDYFQYERGHPQLDVDVKWRIVDHVAGRVGFRYILNTIATAANSKLMDDRTNGPNHVRALVGFTGSHAVALFKYGLQWDSRDNETSTHDGFLHTIDVKLSPGGTRMFPFRYGEATLNLRAFIPVLKPRLTLALRVVGDWLFGNPPFYELARYDDTYAIGGAKGVRGVPAQRYYGKLKAFGNVELRIEVFAFRALGKAMVLGVIPFFDAGRVWADRRPHPDLDGRGFGLKYGAGSGISLQSGPSFVLRADIAASPDASPVSAYFSAGQAF